jgi:hypothetical protein
MLVALNVLAFCHSSFPWVLLTALWWLVNYRGLFRAMAVDIESWFWVTTLAMLGLAFYVIVTSSYGEHLREHLILNLSPIWLMFGITHAVLAVLAFVGTRQRFAKGQKGGERRAETTQQSTCPPGGGHLEGAGLFQPTKLA